ncbi:hypothetical protein FPV67DRAFT_583545 [Lyophyllum atratum]|nr:hypothetical protein FPV67DRAFT_583545 [Lyophyllum atratum]
MHAQMLVRISITIVRMHLELTSNGNVRRYSVTDLSFDGGSALVLFAILFQQSYPTPIIKSMINNYNTESGTLNSDRGCWSDSGPRSCARVIQGSGLASNIQTIQSTCQNPGPGAMLRLNDVPADKGRSRSRTRENPATKNIRHSIGKGISNHPWRPVLLCGFRIPFPSASHCTSPYPSKGYPGTDYVPADTDIDFHARCRHPHYVGV